MRRGLNAEYLQHCSQEESCDTLFRNDFSIKVRRLSWTRVFVVREYLDTDIVL
jgi:hypothetical protein